MKPKKIQTKEEIALIAHYRVSNKIIPIEIPEDAIIIKRDEVSKLKGMPNSFSADVCEIDFDNDNDDDDAKTTKQNKTK